MKSKVVIVGAGGHAKVVVDILKSIGQYNIVGLTDSCKIGSSVQGIKVIGDDSILAHLFANGIHHAFVAIGGNKKRKEIYQHLKLLGYQFINAISPFAYVSPTAKLGEGVAVMPGAVINAEASVGNNVIINTGATIDHDTVIESFSHIAPGTNIAGNVHVEEGAMIGTGARIIPKVKVGKWTVVGAGAVVIRDVNDFEKVAGVPARNIEWPQT